MGLSGTPSGGQDVFTDVLTHDAPFVPVRKSSAETFNIRESIKWQVESQ
jgi:hypothetical protein